MYVYTLFRIKYQENSSGYDNAAWLPMLNGNGYTWEDLFVIRIAILNRLMLHLFFL